MTDSPLLTRMPVAPVPRMSLSIVETAAAVGICDKTVAVLIRDGRLRSVRVGTRHLIPITEIQRWLTAEAGQTADCEVRP